MATIAHCLYCFESLSASLEHRKPLSLSHVEELWAQYENAKQGLEDDDNEIHVTESAKRSSKDAEEEDDVAAPVAQVPKLHPPKYSTPSTAASSTPSSFSTASSTPLAASNSSSRSSISIPQALSQPRTAQHPMFVTWNTVSRGGHKSLRGCIGTFEPQDLEDGLRTYALTSALEDHRFSPITAGELPTLECGVTLLTDFEPAPNPMSWEIGKHGLRVSFMYRRRRYGATYLPDVAKDQGWSKEETLVSLMRKAGWVGRKEEWRDIDLEVVRYQGKKAAVEWDVWQVWRSWVVKSGLL